MPSSALVFLHITAGAISIVAGGTALLARKGAPLHRTAGSVFFVAMLLMTISAATVAVMKGQAVNIAAATTTFYLVATAWTAVMRKDGESGVFEIAALFYAMAVAAGAFLGGRILANDATPFLYAVAMVAAFAAALDISVIVRKGVSGAQRIARHLWRMTFAMFVATGSFFFGQPKFIPEAIKDAHLNVVPPIAVIVLLVFWAVRVLLTRWYQRDSAQTASTAGPAE